MKPYQMRALVACAKNTSLRAAADELALSHSALAKAIGELELELGVPLVVRSPRGVSLTAYGRVACTRAQKILEDIRRVHDEIEQIRGGTRGRVAVATSSTMALCVLPSAFTALRKRMPDVDVEVHELQTEAVGQQLQQGEIDFAVTHQAVANLPRGCEFSALRTGALAAVVRRQHPARRCLRLKGLLDFEWLYPSHLISRREFDTLFEESGLSAPNRVTASRSSIFTMELVGSSDAVALLPRPYVGQALYSTRYAALKLRDPLPPIAPGTIVYRDTDLPPAATMLRELVHQAILAIDWA